MWELYHQCLIDTKFFYLSLLKLIIKWFKNTRKVPNFCKCDQIFKNIIAFRQEAVDKGVFQTKEVDLEREDGSVIKANLVFRPDGEVKDGKASAAYKEVIVTGAVQCGLPDQYVQQLRTLPVNSNMESVDFVNIKSNFWFGDETCILCVVNWKNICERI